MTRIIYISYNVKYITNNLNNNNNLKIQVYEFIVYIYIYTYLNMLCEINK